MAEVNLYLAVVIFLSALLTNCLHRFRNKFSRLITDHLVSGSNRISQLKTDIQKLKSDSERVEDFEQRIALYNERKRKEDRLKTMSEAFEKRISKTRRRCNIMLFLIIEACRVIVVVMNRSLPVFIFSTNLLWPLTRVLSYPTGIPGAVSPVFWGLVCRQFFQLILSLNDNK